MTTSFLIAGMSPIYERPSRFIVRFGLAASTITGGLLLTAGSHSPVREAMPFSPGRPLIFAICSKPGGSDRRLRSWLRICSHIVACPHLAQAFAADGGAASETLGRNLSIPRGL